MTRKSGKAADRWHSASQRERVREQQVRLAADYHRRAEIARICARYELESDEFYAAEQKAIRILKGGWI